MSADTQERLAHEEYIQESNDWRHRDVLTWQLPSILVGVGGILVAQAFDLQDDAPQWIRSAILGLAAGLAFCLTVALEQNLRLQGKNATNIRHFYPQTRRVGFSRTGSRLILGLSVIVCVFLIVLFSLSLTGLLT